MLIRVRVKVVGVVWWKVVEVEELEEDDVDVEWVEDLVLDVVNLDLEVEMLFMVVF